MRAPILHRLPAYLHAAQPLTLYLPHCLDDVPDDVLCYVEERAGSDGRVGSAGDEQVRETIHGKGQIRLWSWSCRLRRRRPALAQSAPVAPQDAKRVLEGRVEACRAN